MSGIAKLDILNDNTFGSSISRVSLMFSILALMNMIVCYVAVSVGSPKLLLYEVFVSSYIF